MQIHVFSFGLFGLVDLTDMVSPSEDVGLLVQHRLLNTYYWSLLFAGLCSPVLYIDNLHKCLYNLIQ